MAISLTESAADRVRTFLASRGRGLGLRLGVRRTGCSGFAYVVNYADDARPDDVVFEDHGVKVFVDPESLHLVNGTVVDFVKPSASATRTSRASAAAGRVSASDATAAGVLRLRTSVTAAGQLRF